MDFGSAMLVLVGIMLSLLAPTSCESHCLWPAHPEPCQYCVPGWYGETCTRNCSHCSTGGCHKLTGRCHACQAGFYAESCQLSCPDHCGMTRGQVLCDRDTGTCLSSCEDGWWGDKCHRRCMQNCQDSVCLFDGSCTYGCKDGWTGDKCTDNCPAECKDNRCTLYGKCMMGCNNGFYGEECEHRCSDNCRNNNCYYDNVHTPVCRDGCRDGFRSASCNETCAEGCTKCNQHKHVCYGCEKGLYGQDCQSVCNSTCLNWACDIYGFCQDGCQDGYHGQRCERDCDGNCMRCNQTDGECLVCKTRWDEEQQKCLDLHRFRDETSFYQTGTNPDPFPKSHYVIIGCVSAAVFLLIVLLVIALACRRKGRRRNEREIVVTPSTETYVKVPCHRNIDIL